MSQTRTQTLHRTVVNPTRNHDYLYDPIYTLSSDQDHARDAYRSHTNVDRIKRVPEYKQMFSALPHFPRYQLRLEATDPVPKFINRRWRGYADQNRDALIRYKTCNYDPSVQVPAVKYQDPMVSGQNRYKYFRRPIIPFLQQVPPEVLLQPTTVDPLAPPGEMPKRAVTPGTRTIEIQTDYRDSEAQTDPYTPEYVVRPGSAPELLTLATLTHHHGLPAGLAEVEMIERARAKRAWEKTLPPLNDVTQLEKRKRMMDEMETKEWLLREQEIEKLQEERLEVLKKLLAQREIKQQELNDKRLDKLWTKKQKIKEGKILKIRKDHIKTIRRLTRNCKNVEQKVERRDFVEEYSGFGSQVHAPMTRVGVFLDRGSEQYVVRSRYLNTFQGLLELEASLPDFVTQPRIRAPLKPLTGAFGYVKKKYRLTKQLEDMHKAITEAKKKGKEAPKPLRFLHKVEKPIPRPPTPATDVPSEDMEKAELAAIFIQKAIRGRAIQNMMYEGKEKRLELVNEVRTTHALQKAEQQLKKAERQNVVTLQRQRRLYQQKESYVNEIVAQIEGESVGDLFDFLSKELIRLQEERRIHAISMLAERRRRLREAEESGRRQMEERRRREEDEIFKQLLKIHQTTVDTYLEDIIMTSVDDTADEQARDEIRALADKINDVAYEMEERRTVLQSEEIVSELVHCFLIPEILKVNCRDKIKQDQKKHILAAHRIIHATTEPLLHNENEAESQHRQSEQPTSHSSRSGSPAAEPMSAEKMSRKSMLALQMLAGEESTTDTDDGADQKAAPVDVVSLPQTQTPEKTNSGDLPGIETADADDSKERVQSPTAGTPTDSQARKTPTTSPTQQLSSQETDRKSVPATDLVVEGTEEKFNTLDQEEAKDNKRELETLEDSKMPVVDETKDEEPVQEPESSKKESNALVVDETKDDPKEESAAAGKAPVLDGTKDEEPVQEQESLKESKTPIERKDDEKVEEFLSKPETSKGESKVPVVDETKGGESVRELESLQEPKVPDSDETEDDGKIEEPVQEAESSKEDRKTPEVDEKKDKDSIPEPEVVQPEQTDLDTSNLPQADSSTTK